MSELVYIRNNRGGADVQLWYGPRYVGVGSMIEKNTLGNFTHPSCGGERIVERIPIKDGEEKLGLDVLAELYPPGRLK